LISANWAVSSGGHRVGATEVLAAGERAGEAEGDVVGDGQAE